MAVELPNSMFIHVPKCAGRWVTQQLLDHVKGAKIVGDRIYDAHITPDTSKPVFAFIREPATFCHSLWHHRARKKQNTRGHAFNWQDDLLLERECQSEDYNQWMENCANCEDGVKLYYEHYVGKYLDTTILPKENLVSNLVWFLTLTEEEFNHEAILNSAKSYIGKNPVEGKIDPVIRLKINQSNELLSRIYNYPRNNYHLYGPDKIGYVRL